MKVILEFDGSEEDFEHAFDSMDEQFNINDSIFWEIDYGESGRNLSRKESALAKSLHRTEYGDIKITVERDNVLTNQVKRDNIRV